ncbi:serine/threonine protein kinase [Streptosporangium sp. NPDC050855]|uniref:serine/threonine protein kinase n=1 Tax=Streptosporangium sp. NPDC050855 TaxID=3366194 RepID=UPI0037A1819E
MVAQGTTLAGRYRLNTRIGAGGMGEVWRGEDMVLARTVAVKVLLPGRTDDPGFLVRFQGEARAMATINHPGVVDVYDYGVHEVPGAGATAYLVMKFVDGEPLDRLLGRLGRIAPGAAMDLIAQAASALQAVHDQGIVHRDIKPGNLLVRSDGTLVLTDFGIARSDTASRLTDAGMVLGTAAYCAPEQAEGAPVTPAVDIYALGVVAYECLAGQRPFDGDTPVTIALKHIRETPPPLPPFVPPAVRALVERSLAKDPARRFPSAAAMSSAAGQAAFEAETGGMAAQPGQSGQSGQWADGAPETGRQGHLPQGFATGQTDWQGQGLTGPQTGRQDARPGWDTPAGAWEETRATHAQTGGRTADDRTAGPWPGTPGAGGAAGADTQGQGRRAARRPRGRAGLVVASAVAAAMCAGLVVVTVNGIAASRASEVDPQRKSVTSVSVEPSPTKTRTRRPSPKPSRTGEPTREARPEPTPEASEVSPTPTPTTRKPTPKPGTPSPSASKSPSPKPQPKKRVPDTLGMTPEAASAVLAQAGFKAAVFTSADIKPEQCPKIVESRPGAGAMWDPSKKVEITAAGFECPPTPTPTTSNAKY